MAELKKKKLLKAAAKSPPAKTKKPAKASKKVSTGIEEVDSELDRETAARRFSSAALSGMLAAERKATGDPNIAALGESLEMVIGIEVPMAIEWLLGANMLPLSRVIQIVGKTGSNKSALAFEIVRWFRKAYGISHLLDVETKYNALLASSIIGYFDKDDQALGIEPCESCTDWQTKLLRATKYLYYSMHGWDQSTQNDVPEELRELKRNKSFRPAGDCFPAAMVVDSVVAKLTEGAQNKVEKDGFGSKKFADEALSITYFLKTYTKWLQRMPMSLVLINHLKIEKPEGQQYTVRKKGGGTLIDFQETIEFDMTKVDGNEVGNTDDSEGIRQGYNVIRVKCTKNSYSDTNREMNVEIRWKTKHEEGNARQYTYWDWGGALVDILKSYKQPGQAKRIAAIVDLSSDAGGTKWWSKRLGVDAKKPVSKTEIGKLISADLKLRKQLRKLFGIREYAVFKAGPDVSYVKMIEKLRLTAFDKSEKQEDPDVADIETLDEAEQLEPVVEEVGDIEYSDENDEEEE